MHRAATGGWASSADRRPRTKSPERAAGAYQNGVALGLSGGLVGDVNKSIGLDGTNDQVSMGDPANGSFDFGTGDFSVESWVKTSANNERVIIAKRSSESSTPYWQVTISDDGGHMGHVRANAFDGVDSVAALRPRDPRRQQRLASRGSRVRPETVESLSGSTA